MKDIEKTVRLASYQQPFFRSEIEEIYINNSCDQEVIDATRRTLYQPRAAVFIFNSKTERFQADEIDK